MSTIPDSLRDLKKMIAEKTNHTWVMSIRAPARDIPYKGYHAGYKDIAGPNGVGLDKAYSTKRIRDRRNRNLNHVPPLASENASSAIDITVRGMGSAKKNQLEQRRFTAWLVSKAKMGLLDVVFIGGPDANGNPTLWEKPNWKPVKGVDKDHTHISEHRDTEFSDRTSVIAGYDFPS